MRGCGLTILLRPTRPWWHRYALIPSLSYGNIIFCIPENSCSCLFQLIFYLTNVIRINFFSFKNKMYSHLTMQTTLIFIVFPLNKYSQNKIIKVVFIQWCEWNIGLMRERGELSIFLSHHYATKHIKSRRNELPGRP